MGTTAVTGRGGRGERGRGGESGGTWAGRPTGHDAGRQQREEGETHAALILRRLEGGCPWLLTKRICLGGGRAVMSGGPHSRFMVSQTAALGRTRGSESSVVPGGSPRCGVDTRRSMAGRGQSTMWMTMSCVFERRLGASSKRTDDGLRLSRERSTDAQQGHKADNGRWALEEFILVFFFPVGE